MARVYSSSPTDAGGGIEISSDTGGDGGGGGGNADAYRNAIAQAMLAQQAQQAAMDAAIRWWSGRWWQLGRWWRQLGVSAARSRFRRSGAPFMRTLSMRSQPLAARLVVRYHDHPFFRPRYSEINWLNA